MKWITLQQFIACYVFLYGLQLLLLLAYIFQFDKPKFKIDIPYFREKISSVGPTTDCCCGLQGVASIGLKYLDSIMLGKYLPPEFCGGIYTIAAFIPTVIEAPLTALKIAACALHFAWAEDNRKIFLKYTANHHCICWH